MNPRRTFLNLLVFFFNVDGTAPSELSSHVTERPRGTVHPPGDVAAVQDGPAGGVHEGGARVVTRRGGLEVYIRIRLDLVLFRRCLKGYPFRFIYLLVGLQSHKYRPWHSCLGLASISLCSLQPVAFISQSFGYSTESEPHTGRPSSRSEQSNRHRQLKLCGPVATQAAPCLQSSRSQRSLSCCCSRKGSVKPDRVSDEVVQGG